MSRICVRCVMDDSDPDIRFDAQGICNHCKAYDTVVAQRTADPLEPLDSLIEAIQRSGRGKEFDCIIGLSGGVDSSYLAYLAKDRGLRPLAVHLDNGWDSELAVQNIHHVVQKLDIELVTHVIDWEEFREHQLAFLRSSVVDLELLTDNAIVASLYDNARREGVKYILLGNNFRTELVMPRTWNHRKTDVRNIRSILRRHGAPPIATMPTMSSLQQMYYTYFLGITAVNMLDYFDYDKAAALEILREELAWQQYGRKHEESFFTKFYQRFILPEKFGIDKRRAHLSNLICSGQLGRDQALEMLEERPYSEHEAKNDKAYVLKKWDLSEDEFDAIMAERPRSHYEYASEARYANAIQAALLLALRATKPIRSRSRRAAGSRPDVTSPVP